MVKPSQILGINARNQLYTSLNSRESKRFGFSKLRTKNFLAKHGIGVPHLFAKVTSTEELRSIDFRSFGNSFALKPVNGSEGKGIIVIKRYDKKKDKFIDVANEEWTQKDLSLHAGDILQGAYSTWGQQHMALIEERVPVHPDLEQYVEMGTPDVRVVVFNKIPVMAGCRIPTKASAGKANIHRGALMLGIDFGTGETTYGLSGLNSPIRTFPHSNISVRGVKIPFWGELLKTAVRTANATGFVYVGVDMFMHPEKGPMVAEINGFPGLGIQLANHAGLKRRLQRVEEIDARSVSHAVRIGRALFAENVAVDGADAAERAIIATKEILGVFDEKEKIHDVAALINTGRFRSAISRELAHKLGVLSVGDTLWNQEIEEEGKVPVIEVRFKLKDRIITTTMLVTKKLDGKGHAIELGRKDLGGFLVGETQ
ncbi:hypothetical protein C5B42_00665 [Candidatus Cerribacteria bacterium 'Amazon FNV 2010 28 9']|uniref:ATP-grasp domain-containing protein n=1 Tax=Candidatus Cerribacteria bacterium 'Amazon FNV 2010 28 9' TaxID=2081795 RepID=A0A317JQ94_9BACT|nr:MAG: hypothetical protein C5B42_00665 [Candidatus Cerribacteria bacterium 'Amazon FNV 2010 28 9']